MNVKKRLNLTQKKRKSNLIITLVNNYFNLNLKENNRKKDIVLARQISMYFIKENIDISYYEIGRLFKNTNRKEYDHATVMHAHKKITGLIPLDKEIKSYIDDLKESAEIIGSYNDEDLKVHFKKLEIFKSLDDLDFNQLRTISIYIEQYYTKR
jgi:hypothetical protein